MGGAGRPDRSRDQIGWRVGPDLSRGQMGGWGGARTEQGQMGAGARWERAGVGPDGSGSQMGAGARWGGGRQGVGQTGAVAWIALISSNEKWSKHLHSLHYVINM